MTAPAPVLMTAEELLEYSLPDKRVELVRGQLVVREPPGFRHGDTVVRLLLAIGNYLAADQRSQGLAQPRGRLVSDSGFTLQRNPDTVRGPDVSYVRIERCPSGYVPGYLEFAPDLAIEVRSPTDRTGEVLAKVADLLNAGALLVWIVDPKRHTARIYRADGSDSILTINDSLSGEDLLPGLAIPLSDLLD